MKAYVINQFGSPAVIEASEMPRPVPGPRQVLIEVRATSVNPLDYRIRQGEVPYFTHAFPAILHADVAGIVREKGVEVLGFEIGDEVYACAGGVRGRQGALAEFMAADADFVALKPRSLDFEEAASLPLVSITAWEAIEDSGAVSPGKHVLIFGGTGGVGHAAVQLAKLKGAVVTATVGSADKARIARRLGADHVVLYKEEKLADAARRITGGAGFDVVFDTVGGESFEQGLEAARIGGTVLTIAARGEFDMITAFAKALRVQFVNMSLPMATGRGMDQHGTILRRVAALVDEGRFSPLIDQRRFSFEQAAHAHAHAESGLAVGKVVLSAH